MVSTPRLVGILAGVTASGKSALALELAAELKRAHGTSLEIVNADSLAVYRGLDVGTAKPTTAERQSVPHALIDIADPDRAYTAGDFARDAAGAIQAIHARGHHALVVGGTGFYLKALLYGVWDAPAADPALRAELEQLPSSDLYVQLNAVDPASALRIGVNDRYRLVRALEIHRQSGRTPSELRTEEHREPDPSLRLWVIDREDEELEPRIEARSRSMLERGILGETRALLAQFPQSRCLQAVGYAQCARYLTGQQPPGRRPTENLDDLAREISLATRQLVKSQRTWFRKEPAAKRYLLDSEHSALWQEMLSLYAPGG